MLSILIGLIKENQNGRLSINESFGTNISQNYDYNRFRYILAFLHFFDNNNICDNTD